VTTKTTKTTRKRRTTSELAALIDLERRLNLSAAYARHDIECETIGPHEYASLRTLIDAAIANEVLASGKSEAMCRDKVYRRLHVACDWGGDKRPWRKISRHDLHVAVLQLGEMITESTKSISDARTRLKLVK
jgi:hypothetical protein